MKKTTALAPVLLLAALVVIMTQGASAAKNTSKSVNYAISAIHDDESMRESKNEIEERREAELDDPFRREAEYWKQRTYPFDNIPQGSLERAIAVQKQMANRKGASALLASGPTWRPLGPGNIGGRTRSVACDPKKDGWVYVAAAGGGVWRTTNHGETWTPLFDSQNSLCMGAVAVDPNNSDVLYAATGEISPASPMSDGWGTGVYKSTDAGASWHLIGLTTVGAFSKIYVHPKNSNLIYAGGVRSGSGLYVSHDAGATWARLNRVSISDISLHPTDTNDVVYGVTGGGVYYSSDGGVTAERRSDGFTSSIGRVSVQRAQSKPDRLYCLIEGPYTFDTTKFVGYVYVSNDLGKTWSAKMSNDIGIFGSNYQGSYDNFVIVHPTKPDIAYFAGIDFYETTNGGTSWSNISNSYGGGGVHPDQQAGAFNPLNPDEVYMANDGGMYRRPSPADDFVAINNGYAVTAYYAMDIDHSADNKTYGGSQDNGTSGSTSASQDWRGVLGGDGFYVAVNPLNPNIIYCENYNGSLKQVDLSNGTIRIDTLGIPATDPTGAWSSPLVMERNSAAVYHGRKAVYIKAAGTGAWQAFSPKLDTSSLISAIGPSPIDESYCYAGYENGTLWSTTNSGVKWSNVSLNGLPKRYVRDVVPSNVDAATAWVCFSGYGTGHIFKTTDGGAHWTDLTTAFPDVPVNALCVHPTNEKVIFAGTDIGVFATFNGGTSWFPYGKGLPRAPVEDMKIFDEKSLLRIATHGRSMWEVDIPDQDITEPEITAPAGGDVAMATSNMVIAWHGFSGPVNIDITYDDRINFWYRLASNVVGNSMLWVVKNVPTSFARVRITLASDDKVSVLSNSFTILEFKRGSVKSTQSFSHVAYGLSYDGNNGLYTTSFYTNEVFKLDATTLLMQRSFTMPKGFDNNFTDMAMDRANGLLYIHRLTNQTAGSSARIAVVDTNGKLIRSMISPASYGIGLELINNELIVGERDGSQYIYFCNPANADVLRQFPNCFKKFYGPRCLSTDGEGNLFQVGTDFGSGSGLQGAYLSKFKVDNPSKETDQMELLNATGTEINARGIEYDPRDKNYWITDLSGNIYKIANFDTPSNPISDVPEQKTQSSGVIISPNPSRDRAVIRYMLQQVEADVKLEVYNLVGEKVAVLVDGRVSTDDFSAAILDCHNLPNGVYTVSLTVDGVQRPGERFVVSR